MSDCWMDAAYAAIATGEHRRDWEPCGVCAECLRVAEERRTRATPNTSGAQVESSNEDDEEEAHRE